MFDKVVNSEYSRYEYVQNVFVLALALQYSQNSSSSLGVQGNFWAQVSLTFSHISLNLFLRLCLKLSACILSRSLLWMRSLSFSKFSTFQIFSLMGSFSFSILFLISWRLDRQTRQMIIFVKLCGMQPYPSPFIISLNTLFDFQLSAHRLNMSQSISSKFTSTESQSLLRSSMVIGMPQPLNISKTSSRESPPEPSKSKSWKICSMDVSLTSYCGKQRQLLFLRFQLRQRVRSHLMNEAFDSFDLTSVFFFLYYIKNQQTAIYQNNKYQMKATPKHDTHLTQMLFIIMGNKQSKGVYGRNNFQKETLNFQDQSLKYCVSHMKGWRLYMEDASIHINNFPQKGHYLFAVLDGHGGAEVAQYVQKHFSLELYLNRKFKEQKYEQALVETFNKMDFIMQTDIGKKELKEIIAKLVAEGNKGRLNKENEFAGCTANVCFVTEQEIIVANAGDSRCVACVNGKAVPLSFDHHPQDINQMKRIKKAGGFVSGGRVNQSLNLSRSIGDIEFKNNRQLNAAEQMISSTPDISRIDRKGVDFIIMGCDGIWEIKNNQAMVEWISERLPKMSLQQIVECLLDEQLADNEEDYYGTDNMSAILIVFKT